MDTNKIVKFSKLDADIKELIKAAIKAREFAYNPYSKFGVGAALRIPSGQIYTGCNVEIVSFTPTNCAERTAACKAISEGNLIFTACAVVANLDDEIVTPCGVCRQFLREFAKNDFPIYCTSATQSGDDDVDVDVLCTSVYNLLPFGYSKF